MEQASAIRGHVSHDGVLVCTVTLPRQCCHPAASRLHGPFYHRITRLGFPWSSRRLRGDQAPASRPIGIARHRRGRPASSAGQRTTTMPPSVPNSTGPMRVGRIQSRISALPQPGSRHAGIASGCRRSQHGLWPETGGGRRAWRPNCTAISMTSIAPPPMIFVIGRIRSCSNHCRASSITIWHGVLVDEGFAGLARSLPRAH